MSESEEPITPEVALGRFLTAIKNIADVDPQFRNQLIFAIGVPVIFAGENDLTTIEPHVVAARKDELAFRAIYSALSAPKLRSILTKSKLATTVDLRGKAVGDMVDMLWARARERAEERGLI